jgi:signal recognition particle subunit SRP68
LELLLLEAERAWAYAQDLSAAAAKADESHAGTLRHNATGRFRRSIHWSSKLLSHCQAQYKAKRLSAEGLVQATAYTLILNGRFMRHREDYESSVVELSVARYLLDQLAATAATSTDQALATSFADEIGAEIRHSAYQLGREKAYEVDAIVAELSAKHKNQVVDGCNELVQKLKTEGELGAKAAHRQKLKELMWEGQPVPVRYPEIANALYKVQQEEEKLDALLGGKKATDQSGQVSRSRKEVNAYDAVLLALSEAEDVARKLVEAQQVGLFPAPPSCVLAHGLGTTFTSSVPAPAPRLLELAIFNSCTPSSYTSCSHVASDVTCYFLESCWRPRLVQWPQRRTRQQANRNKSTRGCILQWSSSSIPCSKAFRKCGH